MPRLVITRRRGQKFTVQWPCGHRVCVKVLDDRLPVLVSLDGGKGVRLPVVLELDGVPGLVQISGDQRNENGGRKLLIEAPREIAIVRDDVRSGPKA